MLDDCHRQISSGDLEVEFSLRDRHREPGPLLEEGGNLIDERTIEFVYRNVSNPVDGRVG